jgi:ABC-type multidrug transport system fused ATPase/permease subunit
MPLSPLLPPANFSNAAAKEESNSLCIRALLLGIWRHLSRRRQQQLGALLVLMLASGVAEVVSMAAVLPFLAVLTDPQRLWQLPLVPRMAAGLGITAARELLVPLTLMFGLAAVLAAGVRLLNLRLNGRLAASIGSDLSCEAYKRTLYQPYRFHVQRNSSVVISGITNHTSQVVVVINSTLQLMTAVMVAVGLLWALLAIDWSMACMSMALFGTAYGLLSVLARRRLVANSRLVSDANQLQLKTLQEGLGAIRDVLLDGNQGAYLDIYRQADFPMRQRIAQSMFLATFPRYALEALGILLIALIALLLSWQRDSSTDVIPLLGTLALGSQRLLPALQLIYGSWALIKARQTGIVELLGMLQQPLPREYLYHTPPALPLRELVQLDQISFRYGPDTPWVLDNIDLEIRQGERIGLIGSTGSGKSTMVDLLVGLLEPTVGRILIDGQDLHDSQQCELLPAWRASIAHVPQSIYLTDKSIAENIAFGIPSEQIDLDRVRHAAQQAQIASFIGSLAEGYDTFVGERGVRLSGGQRQRIGLARAFYKRSQVIILDEATSALDTSTEDAVMESLEEISRELTVVMIAHRLRTVQRCDRVIRIANGRIKDQGPPDQILIRTM